MKVGLAAGGFRGGLKGDLCGASLEGRRMEGTLDCSLVAAFAGLSDPRQSAKVLYLLPEIMLLLLCATLAGADDFVEIAVWGEQNLGCLRRTWAWMPTPARSWPRR